MTTKSQEEKIEAYLKRGKSLTAISALKLFGCFRLASRVSRLRRKLRAQGVDIKSERVTKGNKSFSKYSLA